MFAAVAGDPCSIAAEKWRRNGTMKLFQFQRGAIPLMVSNPHSGTFIPPEIAETMTEAALVRRDTDWFLARLYDFPILANAASIKANLSRYVIDLNRPRDNESLYPGQQTTGLCPLITFRQESIYQSGAEPDDKELQKRIEHYWQPYHDQLNSELDRLVKEFGYVVLLDVHSIAEKVPMLFSGALPHFNFGTNHGQSCGQSLPAALKEFVASMTAYSHVTNGRFVGGYITRCYGQHPNVHAVQLELNRSTYMDEETLRWSDAKAAQVRPVLERLLELLGAVQPDPNEGKG
jgi:N-formylglutamate deformylase